MIDGGHEVRWSEHGRIAKSAFPLRESVKTARRAPKFGPARRLIKRHIGAVGAPQERVIYSALPQRQRDRRNDIEKIQQIEDDKNGPDHVRRRGGARTIAAENEKGQQRQKKSY